MTEIVSSSSTTFRLIVEEATEFAILLLDDHGRIEMWNAGAERLFGYGASEVLGRGFSILFTPEDQAVGIPAKALEQARTKGRSDDARWMLRRDGTRAFVDGVTTALSDAGEPRGFSKICREVTERYLTEQRLAAQLALTSLLNQEQPFSTTAREIMRTICEHLGWDVGALWEVEGNTIQCVDYWRAPHVDETTTDDLCKGRQFSRGEGFVGQVWETASAAWIPRFADQARFPRAAVARRAGMISAFAFPIVSRGQVTGAMEFFSATEREPEQALMPVMTLIGAQIGDFIERRHTSEALRESEERYRLVSETAQDAIFTMDEHSIVLACNPAVKRILGYEPEELIGKPMETIIPERLRHRHREGVARFLATGRRNIPWSGVELPALHKDGHEVPCEISFGVWRTEERTAFTGFARDITERKRDQEALQRSLTEAEAQRGQLERRAEEEAAFRHLASALTGAVEMTEVLREITNRATEVTRADGVYVERIVPVGGSRVVEVVAAAGRGTPPRGTRVGFPGSLTDEILREGMPVILVDMARFGRQMAPYLSDTCPRCEVLVTPLVAENETLGALVLLNSRSSGRHFTDSDVVRARTLGDLTSLALRRVRLLEQEREAREKAEAAVRVRDETLGIVSHDLRNPLTQIALSADLLADAPDGERRELVDTIRASARQMERLIQDLLDVARLESGRFSVDRREIDPVPMLREVCDANAAIAQQKEQTISCNFGSLPLICADRDRLVQVLANLIGNAIKFTPRRGTITVEAKALDGEVELIVRDSGPGIPEADLKSIFTPYWQAKKTAHMGAGLGLAIVRGIVEAHGGHVWAENAPGGGAVFRFTIPVA